jgi:acyl-CoA thioesterase-1
MIKGFIYSCSCFILFMLTHLRTQIPEIRYLPLGDSYTIGTGALEKESWPYLLSVHLRENSLNCTLLDNPARNGFTTRDLIREELPLVKKLQPGFVTLLIGVNDWVQGITPPAFHQNLIFILDEIQKTVSNKNRILLLTIPDFGVTPAGKNYSRGRNISEGISEFNLVIREEAKRRDLPLVDIFEASKKMGAENSLVAADGLHPSAKEYAIWEKIIFEGAIKTLNKKAVK